MAQGLNVYYDDGHADNPVVITEPVIYYYVTADTEFPPDSEVPVADVEAAVVDYLTTGHRPGSVVRQSTHVL
ncbi:Imm1 family immunity protein [Saccharothrix lopnurensis]|uniref:Imm1 family immunity protein n=1 Tax=Saccharothrix lopnurensis TaxID=1670621 RepID=A0ABW1P0L4_9PSEU